MESNDKPVADIDLSLLDIQKDLVRIVVLVSSVLTLQGLTFLFLAWIADGFIITVVIGLLGAVVFVFSLLVWAFNFRAYQEAFFIVREVKEDHPATTQSDEADP